MKRIRHRRLGKIVKNVAVIPKGIWAFLVPILSYVVLQIALKGVKCIHKLFLRKNGN